MTYVTTVRILMNQMESKRFLSVTMKSILQIQVRDLFFFWLVLQLLGPLEIFILREKAEKVENVKGVHNSDLSISLP